MKQWVLAAALCLGALLVTGVAGVAVVTEDTPSLASDEPQRPEGERSHGPPPWVHGDETGPGAGKHGDKPWKPGKPSKQWKQRWRGLDGEQRADLMADLAREHARGMRRWADCVKAADDGAQRADCERPLPPGLAKKGRGH